EIVDHRRSVTKLPDAPEHVLGVVDLRGRTTSVVSPRKAMGIDGEGEEARIIIFRNGDDSKSVGWVVDEVSQVVPVATDEIDRSFESPQVEGIIKQDEEFIIWTNPTGLTEQGVLS
ncbi:MAG: chemotaxis protein CheW, partial [Halobacteriaceae archaeon]